MNGAAVERLDASLLFIAALRGWIAGVLTGLAVFAFLWLWTFASSPSSVTMGELLSNIPQALLSLALIGVIGGALSLPGPILFTGLLYLAERISSSTRNLPFWLGLGLAASLPTAGYVWYAVTHLSASVDETFELEPFTWHNLQLPLLILACGFVATFVAWRTQVRFAK